jgi:hypothetical protein
MDTPEKIVDNALAHSARRSPEYRRGMLSVIRFRMTGQRTPCPYSLGTSQADAYFAGNDRGHNLWRKMQQEKAA